MWDLAADDALHVPAESTSPLTDPATSAVIGTALPRVDIPAKLTGGPAYVQAMRPPGLLHARGPAADLRRGAEGRRHGRGRAHAADGDQLAGGDGVRCPPHQATTPSSSKKPPFGPSSGRVAKRTPIAAPCSAVRWPWCWFRSVAV